MVEGGERGATGDRGVAGERGPKGDHGQHGATGPRGPVNRLALIGYLILTSAVAAAFFFTWLNDHKIEQARVERVGQLNRVNASQCASLQNLYRVIRKALADADASIDELAYYRQFPEERARAHERNRKTRALFKTPPCPRDFKLSPK